MFERLINSYNPSKTNQKKEKKDKYRISKWQSASPPDPSDSKHTIKIC